MVTTKDEISKIPQFQDPNFKDTIFLLVCVRFSRPNFEDIPSVPKCSVFVCIASWGNFCSFLVSIEYLWQRSTGSDPRAPLHQQGAHADSPGSTPGQEWEIDQLLQFCKEKIHCLGFFLGFKPKLLHQIIPLLEGPIIP